MAELDLLSEKRTAAAENAPSSPILTKRQGQRPEGLAVADVCSFNTFRHKMIAQVSTSEDSSDYPLIIPLGIA